MRKCSTCSTLYAGELCPNCAAAFAQRPSDPTVAGTAAEELPLQPGQTFHGLEIVELLGRGGMGVVFKARQPALDRLVALKILPKRLALDPDFQGRFIREAKALGALSHPNIVAIHDFGAEAGLFYFVMEFIDGANLRGLLRDKAFTPDQALKLVPQLCDALDYAHTEGVVHRDIKPENILIDKKGRIKIADFGLAKLTGADSKSAMLTMTNMVMGTPHYMAPEQVENPKGVDHRADIYSMGVVFYEMLTGELPIGRFEVPSKKVQIDVRLDEVVLRTLEKQPEKRYQSASALKDEVTRITTTAASQASYPPTVITPKPEKKKDLRPVLAAAAVLILVLGAVLIFRSGPTSPGKPPKEIVAALLPDAGKHLTPVLLAQDPPLDYQPKGKPVEANTAFLRPDTLKAVTFLTDTSFGKGTAEFESDLFKGAVEFSAQKTGEAWTITEFRCPRGGQAIARQPDGTWKLTAEPVDLARLHFTKDERPAGYVWLHTDPAKGGLPRNPMPARDPESKGVLVKFMDGMGLGSVAVEDLKQGYLAAWFQGSGSMIALETPAAERLEREFKALPKMDLKWSHRRGELLVLAYAWNADYRIFFAELVALTQKKLGLPVAVPDPLPAHLFYAKDDLPSEWEILASKDGEWQELGRPGAPQIRIQLGPGGPPGRRRDPLRAGAVEVSLTLLGDDIEGFEKVSTRVRDCMGYPSRGFDTMVPAPGELPDGYAIDKAQTDVAAVLAELALADVKPADVSKAWLAKLKPAGTLVVLEIGADEVRRLVEAQLKKRGAAEDGYKCVFGVESGDDGVLDDLENRMRLKFGWSVNSPRPILLRHVRPEPGDLPAGWTLGPVSAEPRKATAEIRGPGGEVLKFAAYESHNYQLRRQLVEKDLGYQPGDLLLDKYAAIVHVSGASEAAWPVLEAIEAAFRRKLRMKAPSIEDFPPGFPAAQAWTRAWDSIWRKKADLNPVVRKLNLKAEDLVAARGSSDLEPLLLEFRAPEAVPAQFPKGYTVHRRGVFVALAMSPETAEILRRQLRAKP